APDSRPSRALKSIRAHPAERLTRDDEHACCRMVSGPDGSDADALVGGDGLERAHPTAAGGARNAAAAALERLSAGRGCRTARQREDEEEAAAVGMDRH